MDTTFPYRVASAYEPAYPDPISFDAGEPVWRGHADADNPAWFWCEGARSKTGWVHESFLEPGAPNTETRAASPYNARELSVRAGELLHAHQQCDGWILAENARRETGWVPLSHVVPDIGS